MGVKQILVSLDFSAYGPDILAYAATLARSLGADMILVNVIHQRDLEAAKFTENTTGAISYDQFVEGQIKQRTEKIEEMLQNVECTGVKSSIQIRQGLPWQEVLHAIEETGADLLVMGTRGSGDLPTFLFGSNAKKLHRRSPIPVLSVRGERHAELVCQLDD